MRSHVKRSGMVVGPHPATADAGIALLRSGGNAIDAAVAAAFTEAVVEPANTGVAGYGGAIVAYIAEVDKMISINFDSRAPAKATEDMFQIRYFNNGTYAVEGRANIFGPLSVGVPGVLGGLTYFLNKYGRRSLRDVTKNAAKTAKGFPVNRDTSTGISEVAEPLISGFPQTARLVLPSGRAPKPGEILRFPELADTLSLIADGGPEVFYRGEIGEKTVQHLHENGGMLTEDDLRRYQPIESEPLMISYRSHQILTPPLCSGGLTTLQMLRILEGFDLTEYKPGSAKFFHLLAEVMKASWTKRLSTYGDPELVAIDQSAELGDHEVERLRSHVRDGLLRPENGKLISPEPMSCTAHICTADLEGNVVSLTQTHGGSLGSLVSVPGTGLILGHGVGRFDPRPGLPNSIGPRKQPLHNMSPVLIMKDGEPLLALGTPGGRTIVNNMMYFVLNLIDFKLSPDEALRMPRCHVESSEPVQIESRVGMPVISGLKRLGHKVTGIERLGGPGHVIMKGPGRFVGATDPRGEGKVTS